MIDIFTLLIAYQVKHFICDYPLQTSFMLGKFKEREWVMPLSLHCFVHATGTMLVLFLFSDSENLHLLALIDYWLHFIIDRIKASPNLLGKLKSDSKYFWWALGADQKLHHLTHYFIIYLAVSY